MTPSRYGRGRTSGSSSNKGDSLLNTLIEHPIPISVLSKLSP